MVSTKFIVIDSGHSARVHRQPNVAPQHFPVAVAARRAQHRLVDAAAGARADGLTAAAPPPPLLHTGISSMRLLSQALIAATIPATDISPVVGFNVGGSMLLSRHGEESGWYW